MQTRKRWLGSKIDREIGTELLDAEIKYSQIRFSRDVSKKLVSWLAKHSKNGSEITATYFLVSNFFPIKHYTYIFIQ